MLPELHDAAIDHEGQLEGGKDYRLGECLERFQISNLRSQILKKEVSPLHVKPETVIRQSPFLLFSSNSAVEKGKSPLPTRERARVRVTACDGR